MHVVVIGAGIAGLAAAYEVRRRAPGARVTVLDGASRVGGKLHASEVGGLVVDEGAEMFLVRVPEAVGLVGALGLGGQVVHPRVSTAGVVVGGQPRPLPAGTVLGVPAQAGPIRAVLGEQAARAVEAEPGLPSQPLTDDLAVGEYVERRLGRVFVDRLVDPLLGGVYAGHADRLSLRATVPALFAALRRTGSLVHAAQSVQSGQSAGSAGPVFGTLPGGLGGLPEAVLAGSGSQLRLGLPVREVQRTAAGFRLVAGPAPDPTYLDADAVIVAAPANKAGPMLGGLVLAAATELAGIEYASMAVLTLVYPEVTFGSGSGLLVPAVEGRAVKALTYASQKWAHLAAPGRSVLRASVGRAGESELLHRDDAELVDLVRAEVAALTGVEAAPLATRVTRWGGGLPQYAVGHVERVARIRAAVAAVPGLAVCGAAYEGVGVPACIRTGVTAATQVLAALDAGGESSHG